MSTLYPYNGLKRRHGYRETKRKRKRMRLLCIRREDFKTRHGYRETKRRDEEEEKEKRHTLYP